MTFSLVHTLLNTPLAQTKQAMDPLHLLGALVGGGAGFARKGSGKLENALIGAGIGVGGASALGGLGGALGGRHLTRLYKEQNPDKEISSLKFPFFGAVSGAAHPLGGLMSSSALKHMSYSDPSTQETKTSNALMGYPEANGAPPMSNMPRGAGPSAPMPAVPSAPAPPPAPIGGSGAMPSPTSPVKMGAMDPKLLLTLLGAGAGGLMGGSHLGHNLLSSGKFPLSPAITTALGGLGGAGVGRMAGNLYEHFSTPKEEPKTANHLGLLGALLGAGLGTPRILQRLGIARNNPFPKGTPPSFDRTSFIGAPIVRAALMSAGLGLTGMGIDKLRERMGKQQELSNL